MKGKKCFGLLLVFFIIFGLSLSVSSDANAVSTYAAANRFLYNYDLGSTATQQWSAPVRYNEYGSVTFTHLYGTQINTYPTAVPTGQYVNVTGKLNISVLRKSNYESYFSWQQLENLTVVCGWGNSSLVTDSASIYYVKGTWRGDIPNVWSNANVSYLDINFNWSGHFNGSYNGISSGDLLSCAIRSKDGYSFGNWIGIGSLNTDYVYASNASFESYLSVETSQDIDTNAINGVTNAVVDMTNQMNAANERIIQQNDQIGDLIRQQNNQDQQDRNNMESQQSDSQADADDSQVAAESTGTTLLAAFTGFVNALTSASPSNCNIDMDLGNLDLGVVNLCQLSLPQPFPTIASIMLILFCVPLSIATARKVINLFRSFQG